MVLTHPLRKTECVSEIPQTEWSVADHARRLLGLHPHLLRVTIDTKITFPDLHTRLTYETTLPADG